MHLTVAHPGKQSEVTSEFFNPKYKYILGLRENESEPGLTLFIDVIGEMNGKDTNLGRFDFDAKITSIPGITVGVDDALFQSRRDICDTLAAKMAENAEFTVNNENEVLLETYFPFNILSILGEISNRRQAILLRFPLVAVKRGVIIH